MCRNFDSVVISMLPTGSWRKLPSCPKLWARFSPSYFWNFHSLLFVLGYYVYKFLTRWLAETWTWVLSVYINTFKISLYAVRKSHQAHSRFDKFWWFLVICITSYVIYWLSQTIPTWRHPSPLSISSSVLPLNTMWKMWHCLMNCNSWVCQKVKCMI